MHDQIAVVEDRAVKLSNPEKILFPAAGLTKADLIDYYGRIAPVMLPHLAGRPLSFERYPDGIAAEGFMQKNASDYFPSWIRRARLAKQDGVVDHVVAEDASDLDLPGQSGLHHLPRLAVAHRSGRSSRSHGARSGPLRRRLRQGQMGGAREPGRCSRRSAWRRSSRSPARAACMSGCRSIVPPTSIRCAQFASEVAERLVARRPRELTTAQRKAKRGDRVFVDVARNAYAQTAVAPYSVRARPQAPVATPIEWAELEDPKLGPQRYTIRNIFRRLAHKRDPWAEIERHARPVARAQERLAALAG